MPPATHVTERTRPWWTLVGAWAGLFLLMAGIASGVLAMNRILAGAVGVAVTGAVFHALRDDHGFTHSLANSFWVLVGVLAAGVVLTWAFVRSAPGATPVKPIEHRLHHRRFHL